MGDELAEFYVHEVTVEPLLGTGGAGPTYGPPVTVPCFVEPKRRLVRSAAGDHAVSETTVYCPPQHAAAFPTGSRVTLPDGSTPTVIVAGRLDSGPLALPDHTQIALT